MDSVTPTGSHLPAGLLPQAERLLTIGGCRVSHIFISYSHQDRDYAHRLEDPLKQRGFEVWLDERIDYGTRWPQAIEDHVDTCAALIVILTPHSKDSDWVQNELARAKRKGKPVFPLLLDGDLWLAVEATQCVDVRDGGLPPPAFYVRLGQVLPAPVRPIPSPPAPGTVTGGQAVPAGRARTDTDPGSVTDQARHRPAWARWGVLGISAIVFLAIGSMILFKLFGDAGTPPTPTVTAVVQVASTATETATLAPSPAWTWTPEATATHTPTPPPTLAPTHTPTPAPTRTATPALGVGSTRVSDTDGMVMVYVPAGVFWMGSAEGDAGAGSDEFPQHQVYLDAFWIDRIEVTNAQYKTCVEAGQCSPPSASRSHTRESYYGNPEFDDYPVIWVSWTQADAYCRWADRRLPTEAEWEKAARGTDKRLYPWGNTFDGRKLNFCDANCGDDSRDPSVDDGYADTAPVGGYSDGASPYGALDMAGNVWEWVADWYASDYYAHSPAVNPSGPSTGVSRVLRGGSWHNDVASLFAARCSGLPGNSSGSLGFRCCVVARQE